ncbi:hypothetical protein DFH28DRAFT_927224 [Melampsora americana]|nr:hypothetical protein DFH28DRAFT_927224 [Melampsora americana]
MAKKQGSGKKEDNGGCHQVRMLCRCPWYEELEPVMGDCLSARPMALRDLLGDQDKHNSTSLTNIDNVEGSPAASESTIQYDPLDKTPLCEVHQSLSMDLKPGDKVTPSQEPKIPKNKPLIKSDQLNGIDTPISLNEPPKDPLGLNSLVDCLSTTEEQDQSQCLAVQSQESMTTNIASEISQILMATQLNESATKEKIASNKL